MSLLATPDECAARGRAARREVPRRALSQWLPASDRPDPVDVLEAQAASRVPELVPLRYQRMLTSRFAFFRGAAAIMAGDLASIPQTGITVQLCGDAHLSNFGGFGTPERTLVFSLNDFDETLPGPWEWDLARLAASVEVSGRELGYRRAVRQDNVAATVRVYREAMRTFATMRHLDLWYTRLDADQIQQLLFARGDKQAVRTFEKTTAKAHAKDSMRAMNKLTREVDGSLRIVGDPPLIVPVEDLVDGNTQEIEDWVRRILRGYARSLRSDRRALLARHRYVHLARKVVGVGSVGTRAWVVLLLGRDGADPLFLQVKEAQASVLEPYVGKARQRNHGQRVVEGQWLMQAASDIFLGWMRAEGIDGKARDFYVRQLWDWKVSAELETMRPAAVHSYGELCGWTLARAHARTGDAMAIGSYLGSGDKFDRSMVTFAEVYADQNEHDYTALEAAAREGRITVAPDPVARTDVVVAPS
jgi:uncharacterized protein (DUF2252 family)